MDSLNDDCLQIIFQLLSLKDQIVVLGASKRFLHVIRSIWKNKYKNHLELDLNHKMILEIDELKEFLSNVHENIENVIIKSESFDLIRELSRFQFTNTHKLVVDLDNESQVLRHESAATLFQIFPNLRIFYPMGKFTGEGFTLWKGLEELKLTFCFKFDFDYLEQILKELPLRTLHLTAFVDEMPSLADNALQNSRLSKLVLNSYELAIFTPQIKNLRYLKYLQITDLLLTSNLDALDNELENLRETHCIEKLCSLDFQAIFPKIIDLRLHSHLRHLKLCSDPIIFSEIMLYIPLLPALRVLVFKFCYIRNNHDFQKLFSVSNHLDEIIIEDCTITYNSNPCLCINEIFERRTKLLIVNFFRNKFRDDTKAELITTGRSKLFKLESIKKVFGWYPYLLYGFSTRY